MIEVLIKVLYSLTLERVKDPEPIMQPYLEPLPQQELPAIEPAKEPYQDISIEEPIDQSMEDAIIEDPMDLNLAQVFYNRVKQRVFKNR